MKSDGGGNESFQNSKKELIGSWWWLLRTLWASKVTSKRPLHWMGLSPMSCLIIWDEHCTMYQRWIFPVIRVCAFPDDFFLLQKYSKGQVPTFTYRMCSERLILRRNIHLCKVLLYTEGFQKLEQQELLTWPYPINVWQRVVEENLLQYFTMAGLHRTMYIEHIWLAFLRKPWRRKDSGIWQIACWPHTA